MGFLRLSPKKHYGYSLALSLRLLLLSGSKCIEAGFGEGSQHSQNRVVVHCAETVCVNNMVYADYLLSFWEARISVHARPRVLM